MRSLSMTRARVARKVLTSVRDVAGIPRQPLHRWAVVAGGVVVGVVRCETAGQARFVAMTQGYPDASVRPATAEDVRRVRAEGGAS